MLCYASTVEFVQRYVAATPLAAVVAQAEDEVRAALIRDVSAGLRSYEDNKGLAFPTESHLVVAYA
jgi:hypothetical protein